MMVLGVPTQRIFALFTLSSRLTTFLTDSAPKWLSRRGAPRLVRDDDLSVSDGASTASHGAGNRPPFPLPAVPSAGDDFAETRQPRVRDSVRAKLLLQGMSSIAVAANAIEPDNVSAM